MTFAELINATEALLGSECAVFVEYWNMGNGVRNVNWKIWSVKHSNHFEGCTPEEALRKLQVYTGKQNVEEQIAAVVVPTVNPPTVRHEVPCDIPF